VKRNWQPYVSELYRRTAEPQANVFVVAIPIKSAKDKVLGILDIQVELNTFFDCTRQIDAGPGGFVYIVDQRGKLASHPQFPPQKGLVDYSQLPVVRQVLQGKRGIEIASNPVEGEERVVAYEPVKHGWGVVLSQPSATVFGTRDDQLNRILVAYALILAFLVLAAYFASRIVVQRRQAEIDAQVKAELERRVSERTAQLEISNKELESFSYSVSHDLRAPIRAIDGFAQMLADESGDRLDAEAKRKIAVIRDNSRKMGKLIDALLAFSRLGRQSVATAEVDMAALANEVIEELRAASGNGSVRFVVKPMPGTQCDPALIRQVWVNLLANAVKFTGRAQNPAIEAGGYREGAQNVYYVKDNGAGFDMRYYSKLFGVFQRLHGEGDFPGTGVGLSIVQRVVERHGGRVWAEGKINQGATFYFALPAGPA
jgi:signal transduction histidine kinase